MFKVACGCVLVCGWFWSGWLLFCGLTGFRLIMLYMSFLVIVFIFVLWFDDCCLVVICCLFVLCAYSGGWWLLLCCLGSLVFAGYD